MNNSAEVRFVDTLLTRNASSFTKNGLILLGLTLVLITVGLWAAGLGAVAISFRDVCYILGQKLGLVSGAVNDQASVILTVIRLPRVLMGILIGAVLGMTGASIQGLFRNPLADPGLIGISSGASLFAVSMIVLELHWLSEWQMLGLFGMSIMSFMGACLTAFGVYQLSKVEGKASVSNMLLAGIAINALCGAITGLLTYLANDAQLRSIQFWGLGSLGGATWETLQVGAIGCFLPLVAIPRLGKSLNAFALGEGQAQHLGINAKRLKVQLILLTTLGVGISVALCGTIGFVGLVIPHITRMLVGSDHRIVLPASALMGAILLTLADLISRTIVAPAELPIGIVTAIVGTPSFIAILIKNRR
jgi:iron complex transport system permease protein